MSVKGSWSRVKDHEAYRKAHDMAFPRKPKARRWRVYIEGDEQPYDWAMTEAEADACVKKLASKNYVSRKVEDL